MDVKRPVWIAAAAFLIVILSPLSFPQSRRSSFDPAGQQRSPKSQDGFLDFTLQRINPSDKNYGRCVDEGRVVLLEETVRTGYFWVESDCLGPARLPAGNHHLSAPDWGPARVGVIGDPRAI